MTGESKVRYECLGPESEQRPALISPYAQARGLTFVTSQMTYRSQMAAEREAGIREFESWGAA